MPAGRERDPGGWIHVDEREIAAFLDRSLGEDDRRRVEEHLATCPACRSDVTAAWRLGEAWAPKRRRWIGAAAVTAAAAAVVALIVWPGEETISTGPVLRDDPAELERVTEPRVEARSPADGAEVVAGELALRWSDAGPNARYRITITDSSGDPVWTTVTGDSSTLVPADVALRQGSEYTWFVDVLLPDGRSATTGSRSFEVVGRE